MLAGLFALAQLALAAPSTGADCPLPKVRDAQPLRKAVQEDGNLSIALDAVATACFDAEGEWNGGLTAPNPKKKGAIGPECKKAISSCELALSARSRSNPAHGLDALATADMQRSFNGKSYPFEPAAGAVVESAADAVSCKTQKRSELFAMAQRRSELSKAHAKTLSEYARYRAWLELERQKCREMLAQPTTRVDSEKMAAGSPDGGKPAGTEAAAFADAAAGAADAGTSAGGPLAAPVSAERKAALEGPMLEKWRYLAAEGQKVETDPDARESFRQSQEAKGCVCPKPNAAALARSIEKKEGGEIGLSLITADDASNTRCALCFLDAYAGWKARVVAQCEGLAAKSEYELNKLEQSDDGPSIPQRCFDRAREMRAASQKLAAQVPAQGAADAGPGGLAALPSAGAADGGARSAGTALAGLGGTGGSTQGAGSSAATSSGAATTVVTNSGTLTTINGMTYFRAFDAGTALPPGLTGNSPGYRAPTGPGPVDKAGVLYDAFVPPQSYAPIPAREEGRFYIRLSMSSACVAELTPGPIQARNGDLILVPFTAPTLDVKSPCGGVAEIYYGKEPTPRFSETFGRSQPVSFVFRPQ